MIGGNVLITYTPIADAKGNVELCIELMMNVNKEERWPTNAIDKLFAQLIIDMAAFEFPTNIWCIERAEQSYLSKAPNRRSSNLNRRNSPVAYCCCSYVPLIA